MLESAADIRKDSLVYRPVWESAGTVVRCPASRRRTAAAGVVVAGSAIGGATASAAHGAGMTAASAAGIAVSAVASRAAPAAAEATRRRVRRGRDVEVVNTRGLPFGRIRRIARRRYSQGRGLWGLAFAGH